MVIVACKWKYIHEIYFQVHMLDCVLNCRPRPNRINSSFFSFPSGSIKHIMNWDNLRCCSRHTQTVHLMCSLHEGTGYQLQMSNSQYSLIRRFDHVYMYTYNSNWARRFLIAFVQSFVYILFCKNKIWLVFEWMTAQLQIHIWILTCCFCYTYNITVRGEPPSLFIFPPLSPQAFTCTRWSQGITIISMH